MSRSIIKISSLAFKPFLSVSTFFSSSFFPPPHACTQDMHIISTDEKQVFAAVQEWNQNNTYSLYISDSPGVYFTLSLENLRTSRGPAGNLLVDFYKVRPYPPSRALVGATASIIISNTISSQSEFVFQIIYPKLRIS